MAVRNYFYGVRRVAVTNHRYLTSRLEPFVRREQPPDAVLVKETLQPADSISELEKAAKQLCDDLSYEESFSKVVTKVPEAGEISIGDVVTHEDEFGVHFAIILDFPSDILVWALFLSSKPWGDRFRLATSDEIALAGFVQTKTTYLNLALRPAINFVARGISFPEHRIAELRREYLGK